MAGKRHLSKKQLWVIDDLFSGELDEQQVLKKHSVSRNTYSKWLADELFSEEFSRRIFWLNRHSEALIARYAPIAAAKLVELTGSDKEETARKACLDILSIPMAAVKKASDNTPAGQRPQHGDEQTPQLSADIAGKLLAILAQQQDEEK